MRPRTILLATSLLASGCAGAAGEGIREHTYPPEARYLTRSEIRTAMHRFAEDARALDALLVGVPVRADPALREDVLRRLRDMREAAGTIDPATARTNHPALDVHLPDLIHELELAAGEAEAEPPSYYRAARITGACVHCHGGGGSR